MCSEVEKMPILGSSAAGPYEAALEEYNPYAFQYMQIPDGPKVKLGIQELTPWIFAAKKDQLSVFVPPWYLDESKAVLEASEDNGFVRETLEETRRTNLNFLSFVEEIPTNLSDLSVEELLLLRNQYLRYSKEVHAKAFPALYADFYHNLLTQQVAKLKETGKTDFAYWAWVTETFVQVRKERKAALYQSYPIIFRVFDELANRTGLSRAQVCLTLPEEGAQFPCEDRTAFFAFQPFSESNKLFTADELAALTVSKSQATGDALQGVCAFPGTRTGKVKIIRSPENFLSFPDKHVLVCKYTTIDMTQAMKKAAAIVTDLGGITSHAAIVSREFEIPCVVGAAGASERLKDGQVVEVNADKGVIKIISA